MKAVAAGVLNLGGVEVDCYVLEDETRVLSQRAIVRALKGGNGSGDLGQYLRRLPANHAGLQAATVLEFETPDGRSTAKGRSTSWFVDLLKAYDQADESGELHTQQRHLAKAARAMLRALAGVGIDALVDEATAYQKVRADDALQRHLNRLLRQEAGKWERLWGPEIVGSVCKTLRIGYDGKTFPSALQNPIATIYDIILGETIYAEIKRRNPRDPETMVRRQKHHQFLQAETREVTEQDLAIVKVISDQSAGKREFYARLRTHFRGDPLQLGLH